MGAPDAPFGPVNLLAAFDRVTDHWSPKVVGRVNDHFVKVAKGLGTLAWHDHAGEDELFYIARGTLRIEFEDRPHVTLREGDFLTVPRGVRHNPVADEEVWIVLFEPAGTLHTGDIVTDKTRPIAEQLA